MCTSSSFSLSCAVFIPAPCWPVAPLRHLTRLVLQCGMGPGENKLQFWMFCCSLCVCAPCSTKSKLIFQWYRKDSVDPATWSLKVLLLFVFHYLPNNGNEDSHWISDAWKWLCHINGYLKHYVSLVGLISSCYSILLLQFSPGLIYQSLMNHLVDYILIQEGST